MMYKYLIAPSLRFTDVWCERFTFWVIREEVLDLSGGFDWILLLEVPDDQWRPSRVFDIAEINCWTVLLRNWLLQNMQISMNVALFYLKLNRNEHWVFFACRQLITDPSTRRKRKRTRRKFTRQQAYCQISSKFCFVLKSKELVIKKIFSSSINKK